MKYYTMVDMAKMIGIPESSARGYRDRFPGYMTTIGQGRGKRYTEEALEALRIVATMSREGIPTEDIETALVVRFGVVIQSQDSQVSQPQAVVSSSQIVAAMMTKEELGELFKQAMQDAIAPLHSEVATLKAELVEAHAKLKDELKAQAAEHDRDLAEQMRQAHNEALKAEVAALHDSMAAIEKRQQEREATHYNRVDKRLAELSTEVRRGFWARLFKTK